MEGYKGRKDSEIFLYCHCRGNYILSVRGSTLTIEHGKGSETIPISHIQSFVLKEPGFMKIGTIILKTAQSNSVGVNIGFGVLLSGGSERTFNFDASELPAVLKVHQYVTHYAEQPNIAPSTPSPDGACVSVTDEIRNLKGLLDDGILTQEEFDAKKKQLLGI